MKLGFIYNPRTGLYLAGVYHFSTWTPWKKKYGLVAGEEDLEELKKSDPATYGACRLEEIKG